MLPGATLTSRLQEFIAASAERNGETEADVSGRMLSGIPAARFGKPEEIAAAVGFLATPSAGYITGVNLPVDGGRTGCL